MTDANSKQIGGEHYKSAYAHWDWSEDVGLPSLLYASTKYLTRWRKKNGIQDLEKAKHYIDKHIEVVGARQKVMIEKTNEFLAANEVETRERAIIISVMSFHENNVSNLIYASQQIQQLINIENAKLQGR